MYVLRNTSAFGIETTNHRVKRAMSTNLTDEKMRNGFVLKD